MAAPGAASELNLSRAHYNVEIEHWSLKLVDAADGDVAAILRQYAYKLVFVR
jgi:type VI secretion system protein VasG